MTTTRGNEVAYGSGGRYWAQIDYTVTQTDEAVTIAWALTGQHNASLYDSSNSAGASGWRNASYPSKAYAAATAGSMAYDSGTSTFTRAFEGASVVSLEFWIQGLAEGSGGGGRSTATVTVTVPARPSGAALSDGTTWRTGVFFISDGTTWAPLIPSLSDGNTWKPTT